ncbi:carboxypeptidase-like regulatory domain-containing protein [Adhaeribacter pallidiroseus]|uniref:TonB-dependent receptor SusC n=1 Tax=Adhaeribacter pallidiroseus TaxID=2072847 RepID=A0A369QDS5_9BACT|nr:carboxypeptidase-like regulatory domain-containing protein [Adhaeribacter pallidiroseus]RDC62562.1 TonB-dependent receptor SusC [Adhaeribacter pallidiroseus]
MLKKALPLFTLLLLLSQLYGFAQGNQVTGKVTGSDNTALVGVSIQISGTTQGAISDVDGNFQIDVPANGTLIFSYIGYKNQTVPVNNRSVINVVLESDATALQEVVVTALGIKKTSVNWVIPFLK